MFYLETKDGDRFFTEMHSNDRAEFAKIIESKMGESAREMFDELVDESDSNAQELFNAVKHKFNESIKALDKELDKPDINKEKIEEILCDLQALYMEYFY